MGGLGGVSQFSRLISVIILALWASNLDGKYTSLHHTSSALRPRNAEVLAAHLQARVRFMLNKCSNVSSGQFCHSATRGDFL